MGWRSTCRLRVTPTGRRRLPVSEAVGIDPTINFLTYPAAQERLSNNVSDLYLARSRLFSIND